MTIVTPTFQQQPQQLTAYEWFAIDIETANAQPDAAEEEVRRFWRPKANWKDETIGQRYREAVSKQAEKLALLDQSPVIVVAIRTEDELRCLHACQARECETIHGGLIEGFGTEQDMLLGLRNLLDCCCTAETLIVGHNIRHFDLPKLRTAYMRCGLRMPLALANADQPTFDTMSEFCRRFSLKRDIMVSLEDVLKAFEIESHKQDISGADVPGYYNAGAWKILAQYAMADVLKEAEVFQRMSGRFPGLR